MKSLCQVGPWQNNLTYMNVTGVLDLSEIINNVSLILVMSDVRYLRVDVKDLYELPKFLRFQSRLEL